MPVSASGERLARSSMARRTSSSQSISSGAKVTRPAASAVGRVEGRPAGEVAPARPGSPRKRVSRRERPFAIGQRAAVQRARARRAGGPSSVVEHVEAVGGERELEEASPRSTSPASTSAKRLRAVRSRRFSTRCMWWQHLAHEPVVARAPQRAASAASTRAASPRVRRSTSADLGVVEAQVEQRVVELAEGAQGPELGAPRGAWPRPARRVLAGPRTVTRGDAGPRRRARTVT